MTCWIVVPVKPPGAGKTRLAGVLDDAGRRNLVARMLRGVVAAAGAVAEARTVLLGPSRHGLAGTLPLLDDPGGGLNQALASVMPVALAAGVERLVFVAADLPLVTTTEIEALTGVPPGTIALAPDRGGTGTNALSLPLPHASDFRFCYGAASGERHRLEAVRLGLPFAIQRCDGLAFDIDLPADLALLASRRSDGPSAGASNE